MPSLRRLTIDFCDIDEYHQYNNPGIKQSDFGLQRVEWFRDFASLMKTQYPASEMKAIHIKFYPNNVLKPTYFGLWKVWPWGNVTELVENAPYHVIWGFGKLSLFALLPLLPLRHHRLYGNSGTRKAEYSAFLGPRQA